ncbi:MAG TPA: aminotransferase class V-fold PLP-dependent enzyme, partial [Candidatus Nanoarchaeia archaeon]|nr:aminotransferase class V-fold PLP-dependent enzyme [Candidatus Nanoarchaeia archaeon]
VNLVPLFYGAEKERVLRPGTGNVVGAIGFVEALKEYKRIDWKKAQENKEILQEGLEKIGGRLTAKGARKSQGYLHICFKNKDGEEIVNYLSTKKIYCSTGSACNSANKEKRILSALKVPAEYHSGALRFTLADKTSEKDVKKAVKEIKNFLKL